MQPWPEIGDEGQQRVPHVRFVAASVVLKPLAAVVEPELRQELEKLWAEMEVTSIGV